MHKPLVAPTPLPSTHTWQRQDFEALLLQARRSGAPAGGGEFRKAAAMAGSGPGRGSAERSGLAWSEQVRAPARVMCGGAAAARPGVGVVWWR